ncbi:hypothetical protein [Massilia sp. CCM 8734]|uniref:hypothetical protein n=1 Tax=Massilia sp. CCM 8734 TaxID=2609283 RepID=UPI00141F6D89|nr:hypothetical protein [Massilia sp. CCM 8734]NHZ98350.1 hypothetical protein [Massilia sp. CCM 8734]
MLAMIGTFATGDTLSQAIDTPAAARSAAQWQRTAIDDIEAAYRITLENHPGTYDTANPGFRNNLAVAREQGLALAAKVTNGAPSVPGFARAGGKINLHRIRYSLRQAMMAAPGALRHACAVLPCTRQVDARMAQCGRWPFTPCTPVGVVVLLIAQLRKTNPAGRWRCRIVWAWPGERRTAS